MSEMDFGKSIPESPDLLFRGPPKRHRPNREDQNIHDVSKIKEMPSTTLDTDIENASKNELSKLYHVIILNDDEHTFDYVIEMLQAVFKISYAQALAHTMEAHTTGSSIVLTTNLEEAERKRDQVHAYGPDWRMPNSRGSVAALVEPAA